MLYDREVMSNEEISRTELVLELLQQVQNLGLNGHIQSGNRLVADNQLGLKRKCTGNADTLTLAAGKLMRIAVNVLGVQSDNVEKLADTLNALLLAVKGLSSLHRTVPMLPQSGK